MENASLLPIYGNPECNGEPIAWAPAPPENLEKKILCWNEKYGWTKAKTKEFSGGARLGFTGEFPDHLYYASIKHSVVGVSTKKQARTVLKRHANDPLTDIPGVEILNINVNNLQTMEVWVPLFDGKGEFICIAPPPPSNLGMQSIQRLGKDGWQRARSRDFPQPLQLGFSSKHTKEVYYVCPNASGGGDSIAVSKKERAHHLLELQNNDSLTNIFGVSITNVVSGGIRKMRRLEAAQVDNFKQQRSAALAAAKAQMESTIPEGGTKRSAASQDETQEEREKVRAEDPRTADLFNAVNNYMEKAARGSWEKLMPENCTWEVEENLFAQENVLRFYWRGTSPPRLPVIDPTKVANSQDSGILEYNSIRLASLRIFGDLPQHYTIDTFGGPSLAPTPTKRNTSSQTGSIAPSESFFGSDSGRSNYDSFGEPTIYSQMGSVLGVPPPAQLQSSTQSPTASTAPTEAPPASNYNPFGGSITYAPWAVALQQSMQQSTDAARSSMRGIGYGNWTAYGESSTPNYSGYSLIAPQPPSEPPQRIPAARRLTDSSPADDAASSAAPSRAPGRPQRSIAPAPPPERQLTVYRGANDKNKPPNKPRGGGRNS